MTVYLTDQFKMVGLCVLDVSERYEIDEESYRVSELLKVLESLKAITGDCLIKVVKLKKKSESDGEEGILLMIGTREMLEKGCGYVIAPTYVDRPEIGFDEEDEQE